MIYPTAIMGKQDMMMKRRVSSSLDYSPVWDRSVVQRLASGFRIAVWEARSRILPMQTYWVSAWGKVLVAGLQGKGAPLGPSSGCSETARKKVKQ